MGEEEGRGMGKGLLSEYFSQKAERNGGKTIPIGFWYASVDV